jgi:hypothetical protein
MWGEEWESVWALDVRFDMTERGSYSHVMLTHHSEGCGCGNDETQEVKIQCKY